MGSRIVAARGGGVNRWIAPEGGATHERAPFPVAAPLAGVGSAPEAALDGGASAAAFDPPGDGIVGGR